MKTSLLVAGTTLALAVCTALPAAAQTRPNMGPSASSYSAAQAPDANRAGVGRLGIGPVTVYDNGSAPMRPRRVSTQTDLAVGTEVRARDGSLIGVVVGTTLDDRGYVDAVLVRSADGVRQLPASAADVRGEGSGAVVISRWNRSRVERLEAVAPTPETRGPQRGPGVRPQTGRG